MSRTVLLLGTLDTFATRPSVSPGSSLTDLRRNGKAVWRGALLLREMEHLPVAWSASS